MDQDTSGALWMAIGMLVPATAFIWASFRVKDPAAAGAWIAGGFALFFSWTMFCSWLGDAFIGPWAMIVWVAPLFVAGIASIVWERPTPYHGDMDWP